MTSKISSLKNNLKTYFGFDNFLPNQEKIIHSVLNGKDTLAIMPTGGGKSLCFQLPALTMEGTAIVISPLIALMKDQVDALLANGISAAYFNSSQAVENQQEILNKLQKNKLKLLYVAPESLAQLEFILKDIKINLFAIDEAHCISVWGHDFRPAYKELGRLKNQFSETPFIALTATADRATRRDILTQLNIAEAKTFISSFDRPNLYLDVRPGRNRKKQIFTFLKSHQNQSGIIYCLSRKNTENLAQDLNNNGFKAEAYHAGMTAEKRSEIQENFLNDKTPIIVATIAFGMGIDKSNVRWVIHYNMPKNIEGYYQEIGRSGRDGLPADTLLFHSYGDIILLRKFAENSGTKEIQLAKLERMQQFTESLSCRRKTLLSYFGEHLTKDCGNCDICKNPPEYFDGTIIAQKVCSAIARIKEQESINTVVDILRGAQNAQVFEKGYQNIKTYGAIKDISWRDLQDYIIQLINQGILEIWFHENGRLILAPLAKEVLFHGRKVYLANTAQISERETTVEKTTSQPGELFEKLRELRLRLAQEENVPAYIIFSDASLEDMVKKIPINHKEFSKVLGVGKVKLEKYADQFLEIIKTEVPKTNVSRKAFTGKKSLYKKLDNLKSRILDRENLSENQLISSSELKKITNAEPRNLVDFFKHIENPSEQLNKFAEDFINTIKKHFDKKPTNLSSHDYTYKLYEEENFSIAEIANQRGLAENTIIGHLIKVHKNGKTIDFSKFITAEEISLIHQAKKDLENPDSLKTYFEYFSGKMSYAKIKIGLLLEN